MPQVTTKSVSAAARALLSGVIDYAGLFSPAGLGMTEAVSNYERYLYGGHRWMLRRFILPAVRLDEFVAAQPNAAAAEAWRLSALLSDNVEHDLTAVREFNHANPAAVIDAVEIRAENAEVIAHVHRLLPEHMTAYFEILPAQAAELLPVIKQHGGCAKLRTGGVVPQAILPSPAIASFLLSCAREGVAMKATAGMHHAVRALRPLTYAVDSPRGVMHGFLNFLAAAALGRERASEQSVVSALDCEDPKCFVFEGESLHVRVVTGEHALSAAMLQGARQNLATAFGSCSFEEPVADLEQLGLV